MKARTHNKKLVVSVDEGAIRGLLLGAFVIAGILVAGWISIAAVAAPASLKAASMPTTGIQTVSVTISGMSCGSCVTRVTNALAKLDGIVDKQVAVGSAVVQYDASKVSAEGIRAAIEGIGYKVTDVKPAVADASGTPAPAPTGAKKTGGCGCGG